MEIPEAVPMAASRKQQHPTQKTRRELDIGKHELVKRWAEYITT